MRKTNTKARWLLIVALAVAAALSIQSRGRLAPDQSEPAHGERAEGAKRVDASEQAVRPPAEAKPVASEHTTQPLPPYVPSAFPPWQKRDKKPGPLEPLWAQK
jgi:hypothetical protein